MPGLICRFVVYFLSVHSVNKMRLFFYANIILGGISINYSKTLLTCRKTEAVLLC